MFQLSFIVPPGSNSARAAAASAGFLPLIEQHRPADQHVQALHNLAGAASAVVRTLPDEHPTKVSVTGWPNGGVTLQVERAA